jgi:hypothetical protein
MDVTRRMFIRGGGGTVAASVPGFDVRPACLHVTGDPDRPIHRGTLCPKGSALYHDILSPGADHREHIAGDRALGEIGRHIRKTYIENPPRV